MFNYLSKVSISNQVSTGANDLIVLLFISSINFSIFLVEAINSLTVLISESLTASDNLLEILSNFSDTILISLCALINASLALSTMSDKV